MNGIPTAISQQPSATGRSDARSHWLLRFLSLITLFTALAVAALGVPARLEELQRISSFYTYLLAPSEVVAWATLISEIGVTLVFFACAAVLWMRQPRNPMALFLAMTLAAIGAVETGLSNALINPQQVASIPALRAPVWALRAMEMAGILVLLYIFPDGRFTPRWTRWLAAPWIVYIATCAVIPATPFNPLDGPTWRATPTASLLFGVGWFATGILAQGIRLRRSQGMVARQQLKWTAMGLALAVTGMMIYYATLAWGQSPDWPAPLPRDIGETAYTLLRPLILAGSLTVLPLCLSIAILRHRLFDIDLVINRALVWGALTALTIGLYIGIVGGLSLMLQAEDSQLASFVAAGVIAVIFQPIRQRLQRGVNRLLYGERDDPYAALSQLGQRLGGALAPDAVAPAIVESIGVALKLPYVALTIGQNDAIPSPEPLAVWGKRPAYALTSFPLRHGGECVGALVMAPRGPDEPFSAVDHRLLDDLARQAGVALYAAQQSWQAQQLAGDLQRSRERLVAAREEERRRLRRDLHDGLGPALASLALKIDAAHDELNYDAASAAAMLSAVKGDIQSAVADIRRLVYNLRPPALDDLGLAASIRLLAERYQGADLTIVCDLPEQLPALPAAVEVAIYRITAEALTNVVRHAGARVCQVKLGVAERVELEIRDDGRGIVADTGEGVGLISMRERAAELGGECVIASTPGESTTVSVWLPLLR
ncbi:MAG: GAF domain-containing sensor histidine kinase [Caldilineaceae bacterium]|nr:GAF domain-containing sensor histidine kinase [Caldilineaceae bacterium]